MWWLQLFTLPVLGMIAWEDLRERSIHWWWLPLLAIGLVIPALAGGDQLGNMAMNLSFLGIQLGATYLLLLLRHGTRVDPLARFIGLGDLLFFAVLALGLDTGRFILFLISGLALCVPAYYLLRHMQPTTPRTVPTAGFLALYLMVWTGLEIAGVRTPTTESLAQFLADA